MADLRRALRLIAALGCLTACSPVAAAATMPPRTSLSDVQNDVMCVSCREPLALAQSPQAIAERNFIRTLVAQGLTKPQIEQALVGQYGPAVLARPPAHGFNLAVYIVPPALVLISLIALALALPRWRRRARQQSAPAPAGAPLPAVDAQRLEQDLARFDAQGR